jgi:LysR family cys regulon transcriptional activator
MSLHPFRFVQEAVRHGLKLTETARAPHSSQPGVSKAILLLEQELGVAILRHYAHALVSLLLPHLTAAAIDAAVSSSPAEPN